MSPKHHNGCFPVVFKSNMRIDHVPPPTNSKPTMAPTAPGTNWNRHFDLKALPAPAGLPAHLCTFGLSILPSLCLAHWRRLPQGLCSSVFPARNTPTMCPPLLVTPALDLQSSAPKLLPQVILSDPQDRLSTSISALQHPMFFQSPPSAQSVGRP